MQQVVVGDTIQAVDFNSPRAIINDILGTPSVTFTGNPGTECWGYNEGGAGVDPAVIDELVLAEGLAGAFKEMQDDLQAICAFQGRTPRNAPSGPGSATDVATDVAQGDVIRADIWNNLMLDIQDCFNGRFVPASSTQSVDSSDATSASWNNTAVATASATFSSVAELHAWFNMGGRIGISASLTGGTNTNSTEMATMLANMGDVYVNYTGTSASAGTNFGLGFYDFTTDGTWYSVWQGPAVGGVYASHNALVEARRNGAQLEIRMSLQDADDSNPSIDDPVTGTLTMNALLDTPAASGSGFTIPVPVNTGSIMGTIALA